MSIQSVVRAFTILETIAAAPNGKRLNAIAEDLDLPASTVARMLNTLQDIGVVEKKKSPAGYQIGQKLVALTSQASALKNIAEPYLADLSEVTGETVTLTVLDKGQALYLTQIESPDNNIRMQDWTGDHFAYLHVNTTGKLFLAYKDAAFFNDYVNGGLPKFTENTITDPLDLHNTLREIRYQGCAWVHEEYEPGLVGVAAPIFDSSKTIIAAISVYGPVFRFPKPNDTERIETLTKQTAQQIMTQLNGQFPEG